MPQSFSIKLLSKTQFSGRLGMSGGRFPRHAQNPSSGERRKTLSITHHALSAPLSHHHLYIIHLINRLQHFYRITMSLKRPFVPKSGIKQQFTTTTTLHCLSMLLRQPLSFVLCLFNAFPSLSNACPSPFYCLCITLNAFFSPLNAYPSPFSYFTSPFNAFPSLFNALWSPFDASSSPFTALPSSFTASVAL